jgi:pimeloyl-ACP methyl ester carboxylesterase
MSLKRMTVDGVEIAYLDAGAGETAILCHCSAASHKEWLPLIGLIEPQWHILAPDFIGYGQSEMWPGDRLFTAQADADVLIQLTDMADGPLHLVGHSYGAVMALRAARSLGDRVKSLVLVEPVMFNLLRIEKRREWGEIEGLARKVLSAVANGDDRAAAAHFMRYWLGRIRWMIAPEKFKAAVTATIRKVALEFMIVLDTEGSLADFKEVKAPALLIGGGKTPAPARAVLDMLAATLPNAKLEIVKGAGHMIPFTHPAELNRSIVAFLSAHR